MAKNNTQQTNVELDADLVTRKLSGEYGKIDIRISWDVYEDFVTSVAHEMSEYHNVLFTRAELIVRKDIQEAFERACREVLDINNDDPFDYFDVRRFFSGDIKAQQKKDEEAKLAAQMERLKIQSEENKLATQIVVPEKQAKKARAILVAAGIIKE